MEEGQLWRQYVIAGIANISMISTGFCMGWTSPMSQLLTNENRTNESPLDKPALTNEIAWLGSLLNLGAIFGSFIGGLIVSRTGRKWGLLCSILPNLIGWILVRAGHQMALLYAGRVCWGIFVGMVVAISPMYCAEIATVRCRGALGSFLQLFITLGFLLIFGVGPYISYNSVCYVGIAVSTVFTILFFFMPETPTHYLLKGNKDAAAESLMKLRGRSRSRVETELNLIVADVTASQEKSATLADVFRGTNFKAFYICCALMFFQQVSGINAVLFYLTTIFEASGLKIADIATIIVGIVQLASSFITPFVVDRLGRRILLLVSSCGTAMGLALLGMFFVLNEHNSPVVDSIRFLPVLALVVFVVAYCLGLGPLPWAVVGEMFSIEVKTAASPLATAFNWTLAFLVTKFFPTIAEMTSMYVGFFIFCGCCTTSFFFVLLMLPETKNKSLQEIQEVLSGRKQKPEKVLHVDL